MAAEFDRAGLPVALITPLPAVALRIGATRIVVGVGIPHPVGDPSANPEDEYALRRSLVERALTALETPINQQQVFALA